MDNETLLDYAFLSRDAYDLDLLLGDQSDAAGFTFIAKDYNSTTSFRCSSSNKLGHQSGLSFGGKSSIV